MERVSLHLETKLVALTRRQIERDVQGKASALRAAVDALCAEGYANEEDGPRGAKLVRTALPYRQAADPASDRYLGDADA